MNLINNSLEKPIRNRFTQKYFLIPSEQNANIQQNKSFKPNFVNPNLTSAFTNNGEVELTQFSSDLPLRNVDKNGYITILGYLTKSVQTNYREDSRGNKTKSLIMFYSNANIQIFDQILNFSNIDNGQKPTQFYTVSSVLERGTYRLI